MNGNSRDSWAEKAIVCDDANLQVKLNWELFYKKVDTDGDALPVDGSVHALFRKC